ncbi:MAG: mechanosensitive ion channel family protein [Myxococcales bacterium]|nr:mechanosensitive ion channel family protein [Myxococcales bacterium]
MSDLVDLVGLALATAAALALSAILRRLGRARALRSLHPALPALQVLIWGALVVRALTTLVAPLGGGPLVVAALALALAGLATTPLLRDVAAGLALASERRWGAGDDVRVAGIEGRVLAVGVRSLRLADGAGREHAIPYAAIQRRPVVALSRGSLDAPCEFTLHVPRDMDTARADAAARQAAILSPFASPRRRPEVRFEIAADGALALHLRGFVFDREHVERYRSDVSARLHAAFAGPPAVDPAALSPPAGA